MRNKLLLLALLSSVVLRISAQTNQDIDLSTRCVGTAPAHATITSVAKWMEDPLDEQVAITVSNLYANANDYMEIDVNGQREFFYGAGTDEFGNYIPTNYPPVIVNAVLRKQYPLSIMCPNSGPNGTPLFKLTDFSSPDGFIANLTNGAYNVAVSAFIWNNFPPADQILFTNGDPSIDTTLDGLRQTNLVIDMNEIITTVSLYSPSLFAGVALSSQTTNLLAQSPTGQNLWQLNRFLLQDAIALPSNSGFDSSGTANIRFSVQPPTQIAVQKVQPVYTVLLNRDSSSGGVLNLINPGSGYVSTNYSTFEITEDKFGRFGVGDGCDDATKAPGQGTWLAMGPGCTQDTNRISLKWSVSLGRTFDGIAAGQLAFRESGLTSESYTRSAIYYDAAYTNLYAEMPLVPFNIITNTDGSTTTNTFVQTNLYASVILITTNVPYLMTNSEGVIYTNYDDDLRQVKSCQTFVDIVTPSTNETDLNFYFANQVGTNQDLTGLYTNFSGSPFVVWIIKNPTPAAITNLIIAEIRADGSGCTNLLGRVATSGGLNWTLTQGTGSETRIETRTVSFLGSPATDRIESNMICYAGSTTPAYECIERYHFYPWGSELTQTTIPNLPADYVTTYDYYTNAAGNDFDDPYGFGYGLIKQTIYPDGYWEKRVYGELLNDPNPESWGEFYWLPVQYAFHPCLDGSGSGVTSPADAPSFNTAYDKYVMNSPGNQSLDFTVDGYPYAGAIVRSEGTYTTPFEASEGSAPQSFAGEMMGTDPSDNSDFDHIDYSYDATSSLGLVGHPFYTTASVSIWAGDLYYYDFGSYDTISNVFNMNPTNHFYGDFVPNNTFPDHKETKIIGSANSYYFDGADSYTSFEGHELDGFPFPTLTVNQSTKQVRMFHNGNLVQMEKYVYTGNAGNETGYIDDQEAMWALIGTSKYYSDSVGHTTNITLIDPITMQSRILYSASYGDAYGNDGTVLSTETDEMGKTTSYTYDSLKRVASSTIKGCGSQPDSVTYYTFDADGNKLSNVTESSSLSVAQSWQYDTAGRITNWINQSGVPCGISYSANNQVITTNFPGGIYSSTTLYPDRRAISVVGNSSVPQFYQYVDFAPPECSISYRAYFSWQKTLTYYGESSSQRWHAIGTKPYGAQIWEEWPVSAQTTNTAWKLKFYWGTSLDWELHSPGSSSIVYNYDYNSEPTITASVGDSINLPQYSYYTMDLTGINRAKVTGTSFASINGNMYQATTNYVCLTAGSAQQTITGIHLQQLNGFTSDETGRVVDFDADTNETITTTYLNRGSNLTTTVISEPDTSSLNGTNITQNGLRIYTSTLSVVSPTLYFYDALRRTNEIQSPLGYSIYMTYDPATGWLTSRTDLTGETTRFQYYGTNEANSGKLECKTSAAGKNTYYGYSTQGQLYRSWGDVPYPAQYGYNEYGDLTNLITYRGGSGWSGSSWPANPGTGDNTYWAYDNASGALLQKTDARNNSENYTYDNISGKLFTRSWARSNGANAITVTNSYNGFGDLTAQEYNDATPNVYFNNYNRVSQPLEIVDGSGTNELAYDYASRLVSSSCVNGVLNGITVSNHFNPYYGRDSVTVSGLSSSVENSYGYDAYGRLSSVGSGVYSADYGYAPSSDLLQTTTCYSNFTTVLTTSRIRDFGTRLRNVQNLANGSVVTSHTYAYDALNRRTRATLEDNSYWQYDYDDRDELTSAQRNWSYFSTALPVSGQQFGYAYDNIGNRETAAFGGDTNGANLRTISYSANNLNQYTNIITPGFKDVIGAALATNGVTVNGGLADRHGEYFHKQISVANTNQPVWQNLLNISGTFTNAGGLMFPASSQGIVYDADGNLNFDGVWTYQWDAENRLILMTMTNVSGIANSNRLQLRYTYDYMGRRVQKMVSAWNGTGFVSQSTNLFIYDGWNLLAVVNPQLSIIQTFMWGHDLGGTMNDAGGAGGLLMVDIAGTNCFAAYDGNGNITALINATDKSLAARYEYGPYGELLRETGSLARQNPFRFSTKFSDDESGLINYGSRYYCPTSGRWTSRDPSGEKDIVNLYCFIRNSAVCKMDKDGKATFDDWADMGEVDEALKGPADNVNNAYDWIIRAQTVSKWIGVPFDCLPEMSGPVDAIFAAIIEPRCEAVCDIADAAYAIQTGVVSDPNSEEGTAQSFVKNEMAGNGGSADLDAILLATQIGFKDDEDNPLGAAIDTLSTAMDGFVGMAINAIASSQEYQTLQAWDEIQSNEDDF